MALRLTQQDGGLDLILASFLTVLITTWLWRSGGLRGASALLRDLWPPDVSFPEDELPITGAGVCARARACLTACLTACPPLCPSVSVLRCR